MKIEIKKNPIIEEGGTDETTIKNILAGAMPNADVLRKPTKRL